jgi:hypothetical protein
MSEVIRETSLTATPLSLDDHLDHINDVQFGGELPDTYGQLLEKSRDRYASLAKGVEAIGGYIRKALECAVFIALKVEELTHGKITCTPSVTERTSIELEIQFSCTGQDEMASTKKPLTDGEWQMLERVFEPLNRRWKGGEDYPLVELHEGDSYFACATWVLPCVLFFLDGPHSDQDPVLLPGVDQGES